MWSKKHEQKKKLTEMIKQVLTESRKYSDFVKKLGVNVNSIPEDGQYHDIKTIDIDPNTLGLFAPAIEKMSLRARGGWHPKRSIFELVLDYKYEHPSGSNGYSAKLYSKDNGKTWVTKYW